MSFYSDGKALDVVAPKYIKKDQLVVVDGFHGIAMANASSGDEVALEISLREFTAVVPANLAVAKGDKLYMTTAGDFSTTASGNRLVARATSKKDPRNVVTFVLLPQTA